MVETVWLLLAGDFVRPYRLPQAGEVVIAVRTGGWGILTVAAPSLPMCRASLFRWTRMKRILSWRSPLYAHAGRGRAV